MVECLPRLDERGRYSVSQTASILGVSRESVYRFVREGRLRCDQEGNLDELGRLRFTARQIEEFFHATPFRRA